MLKKKCGLFLGLIVFAGSACVTPTHASSADQVILTYIQASGESGAKDELVVLHNNSAVEVEVTDWCISNKVGVLFACFNSMRDDVHERYYVPPYGDITIASQEYAEGSGLAYEAFSYVYEVTNQSSGSVVNGGDTVSVINAEGEVVNAKTWASSIATGKALARVKIMTAPDIYATTNDALDWTIVTRAAPPENSLEVYEFPIEPENPDPNDPEDPSTTSLSPFITEVFANPAGPDAGGEFIELYNPNEEPLALHGYALQIGVNSIKTYPFSTDATIPPLSYVAFSNADMGYTLVNTTGRVQLSKATQAVGSPVDYTSPKDDYSWVLFDGTWQYTKLATPGIANTLALQPEGKGSEDKTDTRKPCASNQFRNPATGRCKLIATTTSTRTPCKPGQYRSPETNRCRSTPKVNTPAPCKPGQERNPETNRCRKIVAMTNADHKVLGVETKADTVLQWYYWAAIILIVVLILAYGVWEWRHELRALWERIVARFAGRPN